MRARTSPLDPRRVRRAILPLSAVVLLVTGTACAPEPASPPAGEFRSGIIQAPTVQTLNVGSNVNTVAWGDMDADGDLDLAIAPNSSSLRVHRNNGGTLSVSPVWQTTAKQ